MALKNYKVNEPIKVVYQAAGAKTGIVVTMNVYDEAEVLDVGQSGAMVEIGVTGRYQKEFTPDADGDWAVQISDAGGGKAVSSYSVGTFNIGTVGADVATLDAKVVTLDGKVVNLDGDLVAAKAVIDSTGAAVTNLDGDVVTLDGKVVTLDGKVVTLDGKIVNLDGDVATLDGKVVTLDGKVDDLTTKVDNILAPPMIG